MANWWEMTATEIAGDLDAQKQRHDAYWATFMNTPVGQQVLADLRKSVKSPELGKTLSDRCWHFAGQLSVLTIIRERCGVDTELPAIQGEANASQSFKTPEAPKRFDSAGALYGEHKRKKETN